jgi:predicted DCC family thiol-disulfide oxidoreductase YuxK
MTADARSLAVLRVALGALLIGDLASRWSGIEAFDSNLGVLTNHFALFRPVAMHQFSLFFALGQVRDLGAAFWLTLIVYAVFLVGYRTRLFHLLSLVLATSLHARNLLAELPSDVPLHWVLLWTLFLPLGARFSVDSVRRSLRNRERVPLDLAIRVPAPERIVSLAVLGLLLQLAAMHIGPAFARGPTWQDGTALYYALHQSAWTTALGQWVGDHVAFRSLTWGYRIGHALAGCLVLVPQASARKVALGALVLLHLGSRALFDLGLYDWVLLAPAVLLVGAPDWDRLRRAYAARKPRLSVYFDADCGICFAIVRFLKRLDALDRLTFAAGADEDSPPEVRALADTTVCVRREPDGAIEIESGAIARILRSLPFLAPAGWLLSAPGVSWIADRLYEQVAPRRAQISVFFGFAACGLKHAPRAPVAPVRRESNALVTTIREAVVAWILALAVVALVAGIDDDTEGPGWRADVASWLAYPRLFQVWKPALPSVNPERSSVVIDGVTAAGEHVDPLPEARGVLFTAYFQRITDPRYAMYLDGLREYIHLKGDRPGGSDKLASFTVHWEVTSIAPPGELGAGAAQGLAFRRKLTGQP